MWFLRFNNHLYSKRYTFYLVPMSIKAYRIKLFWLVEKGSKLVFSFCQTIFWESSFKNLSHNSLFMILSSLNVYFSITFSTTGIYLVPILSSDIWDIDGLPLLSGCELKFCITASISCGTFSSGIGSGSFFFLGLPTFVSFLGAGSFFFYCLFGLGCDLAFLGSGTSRSKLALAGFL